MGKFGRIAAVCMIAGALAGCTTFHYEYTKQGTSRVKPKFDIKVGVARFADTTDRDYYPDGFQAILLDPVGDLSRGFATALQRSGLFAEVVYIGGADSGRADLEYYRSSEGLQAVFTGEVTSLRISGGVEAWSLIPPIIFVVPLAS
jgi:hypothetical protein